MKNNLNYAGCFCFLILCTLFSCSSDDDSMDSKELNNSSMSSQILKLINDHRSDKGLPALKNNTTAEKLAIDHTIYMIDKGSINHENGKEKFDLLKEKENANVMSENVAKGYPDAQSVVSGWLDSDLHKKNIEGNYTHSGIAAIKNDDGEYYFTHIFYR